MKKEDLLEIFKEVDENKKQVIMSMFDDFIYECDRLKKLKSQIKAVEQPKTKGEAEKLRYFTKIYSDVSQRHDAKIKIFLSTLNKFEGEEDDAFVKWLNNK